MPDTYRIGKTLPTTIYRNKDGQSCAMTFGLPEAEAIALAARIDALLNAEASPVAVEGEKEWGLRAGYGKVNGHYSESEIREHMRLHPTAKPVFRTPPGSWIDADVQASEEERS